MKITYADSHKWVKFVTDDLFGNFGKSSTARLKSTIKKIEATNISTIIKPVDEGFLDWFVPMYEERINSKTNPQVFDIRQKTFGMATKQYFALILKDGEEYVGATIFSLLKDKVSIAYRVYHNSWPSSTLQANPSLYAEYVLNKFAIDNKYTSIVHGKDRNPYGLNSSIGLAAFKLVIGCQPMRSKKYKVDTMDTDVLDVDTLIFELPDKENIQEIKKGYLITSRDTESKWLQVTKYPHLIEVKTIYRD